MLANRPWKKGLIIALTGLVVLTLFVFVFQSKAPSNQTANRTNTLGKSSTGTAPQVVLRKITIVNPRNTIHPFHTFDTHVDNVAAAAHTYDVMYGAQLSKVPTYRANN